MIKKLLQAIDNYKKHKINWTQELLICHFILEYKYSCALKSKKFPA